MYYLCNKKDPSPFGFLPLYGESLRDEALHFLKAPIERRGERGPFIKIYLQNSNLCHKLTHKPNKL